MWWFTSTTGASAHWPKQATVRTVNWRSGVVSASLSASLVSLGLLLAQPQVEAELLQQIARAARVAGRAAADADHVVALRIEVEERIKGGGAVDSWPAECRSPRRCSAATPWKDTCARWPPAPPPGFPAARRAGPVLGDRLVDQQPFVSIQDFDCDTLHDSSASKQDSSAITDTEARKKHRFASASLRWNGRLDSEVAALSAPVEKEQTPAAQTM